MRAGHRGKEVLGGALPASPETNPSLSALRRILVFQLPNVYLGSSCSAEGAEEFVLDGMSKLLSAGIGHAPRAVQPRSLPESNCVRHETNLRQKRDCKRANEILSRRAQIIQAENGRR